MSNPLSNANNEHEQNVNLEDTPEDLQAMFEASLTGNTEESRRLHSDAAEVVEDPVVTDPVEDTVVDEAVVVPDPDTSEAVTPASPDSSTDELAALREQLHRAKSDAGRVPHLNRRVQELEKQLASVQVPASSPDTPDELPKNLKTKLDKMREIDPEMADLIEETFRSNAAETKQLAAAHQTKVNLDHQRQEEEYIRDQYNRVLAAIPEAEEVFRSPEWKKWTDMLSPNYRAMAESSDANEVVTALNAFKVDAENHLGGYKWGKTAATTPAPTPQVSSTARAAENSRTNRLATAATVKPVAARPTAELDIQELFNQSFNKTLAANTRV